MKKDLKEKNKTKHEGLICKHCGGTDTIIVRIINNVPGGARFINRCETCNLCFVVFQKKIIKKNLSDI